MNLVRNVLDGSWEDILKKICYARTGYEDLNEFLQSEIFSKDNDDNDEDDAEDQESSVFCAILTKKIFSKVHKNRARFGMIFVRYMY